MLSGLWAQANSDMRAVRRVTETERAAAPLVTVDVSPDRTNAIYACGGCYSDYFNGWQATKSYSARGWCQSGLTLADMGFRLVCPINNTWLPRE